MRDLPFAPRDLFYISGSKLNNSKNVQAALRNNAHGFCLLGPPLWGCSGAATACATPLQPCDRNRRYGWRSRGGGEALEQPGLSRLASFATVGGRESFWACKRANACTLPCTPHARFRLGACRRARDLGGYTLPSSSLARQRGLLLSPTFSASRRQRLLRYSKQGAWHGCSDPTPKRQPPLPSAKG
jgi:hypothetical protein